MIEDDIRYADIQDGQVYDLDLAIERWFQEYRDDYPELTSDELYQKALQAVTDDN